MPKKNRDPLDFLDTVNTTLNAFEKAVNFVDSKLQTVDRTASILDNRYRARQPEFPEPPIEELREASEEVLKPLVEPPLEHPESGKTFEGQSQESYCLECIERHAMMAKTELRHAIDRFRSADKMTTGVVEKVRIALAEMNGIVQDVSDTHDASPEVQKGLQEILDAVRWISKEYGISGRGLTRGYGSMEDLEELKTRVANVQLKAYELVEQCPTCTVIR